MNLDDLIGIAENEALKTIRAAGYLDRIVSRDGEDFIITADLRPDRVNLTIRGNKVIDAEIY